MAVVIYKRTSLRNGDEGAMPVGVHPGNDVAEAQSDVAMHLPMFPELFGFSWFGKLVSEAEANRIRALLYGTPEHEPELVGSGA